MEQRIQESETHLQLTKKNYKQQIVAHVQRIHILIKLTYYCTNSNISGYKTAILIAYKCRNVQVAY